MSQRAQSPFMRAYYKVTGFYDAGLADTKRVVAPGLCNPWPHDRLTAITCGEVFYEDCPAIWFKSQQAGRTGFAAISRGEKPRTNRARGPRVCPVARRTGHRAMDIGDRQDCTETDRPKKAGSRTARIPPKTWKRLLASAGRRRSSARGDWREPPVPGGPLGGQDTSLSTPRRGTPT